MLLDSYISSTASQNQGCLQAEQTFMMDSNVCACQATAEDIQMNKHI